MKNVRIQIRNSAIFRAIGSIFSKPKPPPQPEALVNIPKQEAAVPKPKPPPVSPQVTADKPPVSKPIILVDEPPAAEPLATTSEVSGAPPEPAKISAEPSNESQLASPPAVPPPAAKPQPVPESSARPASSDTSTPTESPAAKSVTVSVDGPPAAPPSKTAAKVVHPSKGLKAQKPLKEILPKTLGRSYIAQISRMLTNKSSFFEHLPWLIKSMERQRQQQKKDEEVCYSFEGQGQVGQVCISYSVYSCLTISEMKKLLEYARAIGIKIDDNWQPPLPKSPPLKQSTTYTPTPPLTKPLVSTPKTKVVTTVVPEDTSGEWGVNEFEEEFPSVETTYHRIIDTSLGSNGLDYEPPNTSQADEPPPAVPSPAPKPQPAPESSAKLPPIVTSVIPEDATSASNDAPNTTHESTEASHVASPPQLTESPAPPEPVKTSIGSAATGEGADVNLTNELQPASPTAESQLAAEPSARPASETTSEANPDFPQSIESQAVKSEDDANLEVANITQDSPTSTSKVANVQILASAAEVPPEEHQEPQAVSETTPQNEEKPLEEVLLDDDSILGSCSDFNEEEEEKNEEPVEEGLAILGSFVLDLPEETEIQKAGEGTDVNLTNESQPASSTAKPQPAPESSAKLPPIVTSVIPEDATSASNDAPNTTHEPIEASPVSLQLTESPSVNAEGGLSTSETEVTSVQIPTVVKTSVVASTEDKQQDLPSQYLIQNLDEENNLPLGSVDYFTVSDDLDNSEELSNIGAFPFKIDSAEPISQPILSSLENESQAISGVQKEEYKQSAPVEIEVVDNESKPILLSHDKADDQFAVSAKAGKGSDANNESQPASSTAKQPQPVSKTVPQKPVKISTEPPNESQPAPKSSAKAEEVCHKIIDTDKSAKSAELTQKLWSSSGPKKATDRAALEVFKRSEEFKKITVNKAGAAITPPTGSEAEISPSTSVAPAKRPPPERESTLVPVDTRIIDKVNKGNQDKKIDPKMTEGSITGFRKGRNRGKS